MGTLLKVFGVLGLVVVALMGGVVLYGFLVGPKLDSESKAYVDNTIAMLVQDWNPEELKSRSSKELLTFLKEPDLSECYAMFRKLGRMTRYNGSHGESHTNLDVPRGMLTTAGYTATADFENGQGTITMTLIKRNGHWEILEFRVDSPLFFARRGIAAS